VPLATGENDLAKSFISFLSIQKYFYRSFISLGIAVSEKMDARV